MPRIYPAASLPARYGSSEKYSKLRPHSGLRFMLSPGPNTTDTSCAAASSPKAAPISSPSAASQLLAMADAVGKQVAGTRGIQPKWSLSPACFAQAVGTVRQPDLRDAVFGHTPRFEGFRAGKQRAFFFQGQFFQQKFCILHIFSLLIRKAASNACKQTSDAAFIQQVPLGFISDNGRLLCRQRDHSLVDGVGVAVAPAGNDFVVGRDGQLLAAVLPLGDGHRQASLPFRVMVRASSCTSTSVPVMEAEPSAADSVQTLWE